MQVQRVKSFSWFNFTSGKISFILTIPYAAYANLQKLRYSLHVDNQSSAEVVGYSVAIVRKVVYTATIPRKRSRIETCNVFEGEYAGECPRQCIRVFENDFEIPSTVPTTEDNGNIKISYTFELTAIINGLTFDVQFSIPVEIGSIPLRESLQEQLTIGTRPSVPIKEGSPPSYKECGEYNLISSFV